MLGLGSAVLFLLVAAYAVRAITVSLLEFGPRVMRLHGQLNACPRTCEYRYRLSEVVTRWDDGTIVALPVRQQAARSPRQDRLRAAA